MSAAGSVQAAQDECDTVAPAIAWCQQSAHPASLTGWSDFQLELSELLCCGPTALIM